MTPAAVLRVLVQADGLAKTAAQIEALDTDLKKASAAADSASGSFTGAGKDVRKMGADVDKARGHVKALGNDTDETNRNVRRFGAAVGSASGGVGLLSGAVGALGGGFGKLTGSLVGMLPLLVATSGALFAVGAALGPLVGLGGAAAVGLLAAAQAFGVFKLATMGVSDALKEQITAHKGAAAAAATGASQQRASAKAIEAAQESVRTAKLAVGDASRQVQDALRNEKIVGEALVEAQMRAKTVQEALTAARNSARRELEDMRASLAGAVLDEKQAALDVTKAYERLNEVNADATSTASERAQALLDVEQSELRLRDATTDRARAQKDTAKADKDGIKGSAQVVAAEQQVADAHKAVIDAKRQSSDAARATADAERGLVEAQRQVRMALKGVTEAQAAAAATAGSAAIAAGKLNEKFNDLPPAAQAFVRTLEALKPKLDQIRAVAAAGLFPGVTAGLQAAMGSFDAVKKVVGQTAGVMGNLAERAGELVGSKGFGKDLETIGSRNALVIDRVGRAAIYLADGFRHLLVAAGPLTTWLAKVTMEWSRGAAEALKAGRESGKLGEFFHETRKTLIRVVSIIRNLATAFYEMGKAAAPSGRGILKVLDDITGRFAKWTQSIGGQRALQDFFTESTKLSKQLAPALGGVLASVGELAFRVMPAYIAILEALGPLAGPLIQAFILYKVALTGVAVATNLVAAAQWLWNAAMTANPIALVIVAIAALVAGIVVAYHESETFRKIVDDAWATIKKVAAWLVDAGVKAFNWLATAVKDAWNAIKNATSAVWGAIDKYVKGIWEGLKLAATIYFTIYKTIITTAWNVIKAVTTTVWDAITTITTGAWEGLKTAATVAWELIKLAILTPIRAVRDIIGGKDGIWDQIKGVAKTAWEGIKTVIDKAAEPILDVILAPFKAAVKGVAKFAKLILQVIGKIPGVDTSGPVEAIDKFVSGLATGGVFQAFARGGAYARTGGVVNSPITLMGEEAPRHPEFVIPTNPAHRKRAQGLAMQAAKAVGLAKGGKYDRDFGQGSSVTIPFDAAAQLAEAAGLPGITYAQIAIGESGLRPGAVSNDGGYGLWQMTPRVQSRATVLAWNKIGSYFNPWNNAQQAKVLAGSGTGVSNYYGTSNVTDWNKHYTGSTEGYIPSGFANSPSLNPLDLIKQLPGIGDLPGWLQGAGKWVLDRAGEFIKSKVAGVLGGSVPGWGVLDRLAESFGVPISSTYRPDSSTYHGKLLGVSGRARATDYSNGTGPTPEMLGLAQAMASEYGSQLKELFYTPLGFSIKDGQRVPWFVDGHYNHVHAAFAKGGAYGGLPFVGAYANGGVVPRTGMAMVHQGETITPAGGVPEFHIYIGDREITDMIDVRIVERDRRGAATYRAGAR